MINLLPTDEKIHIKRLYVMRVVTMVIFVLSLVSLIGYVLLIPSFFLTNTKEALVAQEREILEASQEYVAFEELRETVQIVNARLGVLDRGGEILLSDELLTKLLLLKTEAVTYRSINYTQQESYDVVELRGEAKNREDLVAFIRNIESQGELDVIEAPVSNYIDANNLAYVLKLALLTPEIEYEEE